MREVTPTHQLRPAKLRTIKLIGVVSRERAQVRTREATQERAEQLFEAVMAPNLQTQGLAPV